MVHQVLVATVFLESLAHPILPVRTMKKVLWQETHSPGQRTPQCPFSWGGIRKSFQGLPLTFFIFNRKTSSTQCASHSRCQVPTQLRKGSGTECAFLSDHGLLFLLAPRTNISGECWEHIDCSKLCVFSTFKIQHTYKKIAQIICSFQEKYTKCA